MLQYRQAFAVREPEIKNDSENRVVERAASDSETVATGVDFIAGYRKSFRQKSASATLSSTNNSLMCEFLYQDGMRINGGDWEFVRSM